MEDVLQLVYEYRRLVTRRDLMCVPLDAKDGERLDALERLFGRQPAAEPNEGVDGAAGRRRHARCVVDTKAVIRVAGAEHPVRVVNLGGGGLCIDSSPALRPGQTAVVRIERPHSPLLYQYEVEVRWIDEGVVGLPFRGIPRQLSRPQPPGESD